VNIPAFDYAIFFAIGWDKYLHVLPTIYNEGQEESKEINDSELVVKKKRKLKGWSCIFFDENKKEWIYTAFLKKKEVPARSIGIHRCQIYTVHH
jgi:hypothetical protein